MIVNDQAAGPSSAPDGMAIHPGDQTEEPAAGRLASLVQRGRKMAADLVIEWHKFRKFMWNSDKREVMGRNRKSWAQIGLFYLVYYLFLAGFWAAMFAIFYQTVSTGRPTYNSLVTPPGLSVVPYPDGQRIEYGRNSTDVDRMRYEEEIIRRVFNVLDMDQSTHEDCPDIPNVPIADPPQQRFCRYDPALLGPCAPDLVGNFTGGYDSRQPCLYLGLNRVWGWFPEEYDESELEAILAEANLDPASANYTTERILFTCDVREEDRQYVDFVNIYPPEGVSFGHYPYVVGTDPAQQARYIRPVVAAQIGINTNDVDVRMECRARAANIPDVAEPGLFGSREEPSRLKVRIMVRSPV